MVKNNPLDFSLILSIIKSIYKALRPWLIEEAKKSETPIDDWMIGVLDKLLLD